jgi:hypothetical protein
MSGPRSVQIALDSRLEVQKFNGQIDGPATITEDLLLQGMVTGNATVASGVNLVLHGMVTGDLVVEHGATAVVYGTVAGSVINRGRVEVAGRIVGALRDEEGGQSTVHPDSDIRGG